MSPKEITVEIVVIKCPSCGCGVIVPSGKMAKCPLCSGDVSGTDAALSQPGDDPAPKVKKPAGGKHA